MDALSKMNIGNAKVKWSLCQSLVAFYLIICNQTNLFKNIPEVKHEEILQSTTDATEWKLEVERVLPQLKVTIKTDHKVGFDSYLVVSPWELS